jgi:cytochrome c oxidase assembly factor CtaG
MIAVLLLVVAPLLIIANTINLAVERHNKDVKRQNMGEW